MIAALFVRMGGVYYGLDDVEPWGWPNRDAREYAGPWPVVAHPPCERWGSYAHGSPVMIARGFRKTVGDDGGCFAAALKAVETNGGVLEHPAYSRAWHHFGLPVPNKNGGWTRGQTGWSCHVEQGHYGHPAPKATWLYAVCPSPQALKWGPSGALGRIGFHRDERRRAAAAAGIREIKKSRRASTPPAFRDLLLSIARSARAPQRDTPGGTR